MYLCSCRVTGQDQVDTVPKKRASTCSAGALPSALCLLVLPACLSLSFSGTSGIASQHVPCLSSALQ